MAIPELAFLTKVPVSSADEPASEILGVPVVTRFRSWSSTLTTTSVIPTLFTALAGTETVNDVAAPCSTEMDWLSEDRPLDEKVSV